MLNYDFEDAARKALDRVRPWLSTTPLIESKVYEGLFLKCDQFQKTGSFKIRGALNKISKILAEDKSERNFLTASSGNHGIACAQAGLWLGGDVTVVLPSRVDVQKSKKLECLGAKLLTHGEEAGQAELFARELASSRRAQYISPYNDWDVISGQATIGLELQQQMSVERPLNIFVATGGGGLISGIAGVLKSHAPNAKVWMVSAANSSAMHQSLVANRIVEVAHEDTFAEGVAGGIDSDSITFELCRALVDHHVLCDEDEICNAYQLIALKEGMLVEGSAAMAYAGYLGQKDGLDQGSVSVVILCGGNIDHSSLIQARHRS
jgi:threonine dehydratase